jgi:hypothetical protein
MMSNITSHIITTATITTTMIMTATTTIIMMTALIMIRMAITVTKAKQRGELKSQWSATIHGPCRQLGRLIHFSGGQ